MNVNVEYTIFFKVAKKLYTWQSYCAYCAWNTSSSSISSASLVWNQFLVTYIYIFKCCSSKLHSFDEFSELLQTRIFIVLLSCSKLSDGPLTSSIFKLQKGDEKKTCTVHTPTKIIRVFFFWFCFIQTICWCCYCWLV